MADEPKSFIETNRDVIALAVLSVLVLFVYLQTSTFKFINFDDSLYVYENPMVLSGLNWASVKWALTTFHAGNWHPLTWLSLEIDVSLWGTGPGMLHVVNVIFHLMGSVLAYFALERMTGRFWESLAVAALFAVHPTHVESVAWISERKDVLSTVFWFASMWSYARWCRDGGKPWTRYYVAALVLFAIGLTAKPMVITLPFVLILCDVWPLDRAGDGKARDFLRLAAEKAPFFLLSIASAVVTVIAQRSAAAVQSLGELSLGLRVGNAAVSYAKYVLAAIWPAKLAVWYPYENDLGIVPVAGAAVFLIAVTAVCVWQFSSRKYLLVGWLWFVGTLIPVIGLVQVGAQSMADRYTYVPYTGLFIIAVWGLAELAGKLKLNAWFPRAAIAAAVVILAVAGNIQASYWINSEALFKKTLSVTRGNYMIQHNLCDSLISEKSYDEGEAYCRSALESKPDFYETYNTLGMLAVAKGQFEDAETDFSQTVRLAPGYALAYANLATVQTRLGKLDDAEANLLKAAALSSGVVNPQVFSRALADLAAAHEQRNDFQKASEMLTRMVNLNPDDLTTRLRLGYSFYKLDKLDDARAQAEYVLGHDPNNPFGLSLSGLVYMGQKKNDQAIAQFEAALRIKPDLEDAKQNLQKIKGEKR